jgi:hypothetical protein
MWANLKESPMYEHLERFLQGFAPLSEAHLKGVYCELAREFFAKLRQQIEVTQNELRDGEHLEIYYTAPSNERIQVSKIAYLEPGLLVLYGTDAQLHDCKVLANLQTVQLLLKLVRNGAPEKQRPISFVEPTRNTA